MIIGISGTQCMGKTTFIEDFIKARPVYTTPENTYREMLKKKGLPCNQETTPETQTLLMNYVVDQVMGLDLLHDMVILDRTPYDVLAYSMWANAKGGEGFTDEFIMNQIVLAKEASSFFSMIFYVPMCEQNDIKIVEDDLRDTDPVFREEIDHIFSAIYKTYMDQSGTFFKADDSPAVIELLGSRDERVASTCAFYVSECGAIYGEEDSLVSDVIGEVGGDIVGGEVPDIVL